MKQGPNVKKLIAHKMSLLMIPPGTKEGLATAIDALTKPGNIGKVAKEATQWVEAALFAIRNAKEPNPWKNADDETIAGEILQKIRRTK